MRVDESLRRRAKLEQLYKYRERDELAIDGKKVLGFVTPEGMIYLDASLGERQARVYLHEVAHVIAARTGLDSSPDAAAHNEYFAALLATMYRRTDLIRELRVYEFLDTTAGPSFYMPKDVMPSPKELARRFRYIIRRSAQLAKTDLTIEAIAHKIYEEDALPHWQTGDAPVVVEERHPRWLDVTMGAVGGGALAVIGMAAAMIA